MKVKLLNPNGILESAYFSKLHEGISELIINTKERWIYKDYTESGDGYLNFGYYPEDDDDPDGEEDVVSLEAENEEERIVLSRLTYSNHCKDQEVILFISNELLTERI